MKGWEEHLLTVEGIKGDGRLKLAGKKLDVSEFQVCGGKIEIRARVQVDSTGAFGKVLASYGVLKAGVELAGKERKLHLVGAEHWFEAK